MKIEIDDGVLVDTIVDRVVEKLKPLLNNNHKAKDNELMSVSEVAKYLQVTVSWVYERTHTRKIPFLKVGKFPRFRKSHVDLWTLNPYHPDLDSYNLKLRKGGERE